MISGKPFRTLTDLVIFVMLAVLPAFYSSSIDAGERFYNAGAGGTGVRELPLFVAKDLGTFEKYGLDVELIATNGGSPLVQALVGGSLQIRERCRHGTHQSHQLGCQSSYSGGFS